MCARITRFALLACAILIIQLFCVSYANEPVLPKKAEVLLEDGQLLEKEKSNIISLIQKGKYEQAKEQT